VFKRGVSPSFYNYFSLALEGVSPSFYNYFSLALEGEGD
jgi:hypothetical protein